jgi:short-subunit dehydrogenase
MSLAGTRVWITGASSGIGEAIITPLIARGARVDVAGARQGRPRLSARRQLPGMLSRGQGHIAGVASAAGFRAVPTAAAYGASKAAVIHLLDSIRFELEPKGIRVTVINPGFVKTPLTDRNRFPMPFLMPVARAAEALVKGWRRGGARSNSRRSSLGR